MEAKRTRKRQKLIDNSSAMKIPRGFSVTERNLIWVKPTRVPSSLIQLEFQLKARRELSISEFPGHCSTRMKSLSSLEITFYTDAETRLDLQPWTCQQLFSRSLPFCSVLRPWKRPQLTLMKRLREVGMCRRPARDYFLLLWPDNLDEMGKSRRSTIDWLNLVALIHQA